MMFLNDDDLKLHIEIKDNRNIMLGWTHHVHGSQGDEELGGWQGHEHETLDKNIIPYKGWVRGSEHHSSSHGQQWGSCCGLRHHYIPRSVAMYVTIHACMNAFNNFQLIRFLIAHFRCPNGRANSFKNFWHFLICSYSPSSKGIVCTIPGKAQGKVTNSYLIYYSGVKIQWKNCC